MATLDRWRAFLTTPKTVVFPRLELIGRDHAPSIVVGSGEVRMASPDEFAFTLTGTPADIQYALAETNRQHESRYEGLNRLRLRGTDIDGVNWSGGYTIARVDPRDESWSFTGDIDGLLTIDHSSTVSQDDSTELLFLSRVGDPMSMAVPRFVRTRQPNGEFRREYALECLGSELRFVDESSSSALSITASNSAELPATYAENWLSEPLRVMFGQLIFPRLVARNSGNGRAQVGVRRCPRGDTCGPLGGALG